jgi:hypothetical protein
MIHLANEPNLRRAGWRPATPGRPTLHAGPRPQAPSHAWPFLSRPQADREEPSPAARRPHSSETTLGS